MQSSKTVFITGATSGFGEACAHQFAQNGYRIIINRRRYEHLKKLSETLRQNYNAESYLAHFNVQDQQAVFKAIAQLPEAWQTIDVLVNNAGLALGRDLFDEASLEDWNTMIDTNVKGLLYVSKAVLPFMTKRNKGH